MIIPVSTVQKIVQGKPRAYLLIENLTDSIVYVSAREYPDPQDYVKNSLVLKENGVLELNPCMYQGSFYAYSVTESDIRVMEL